MDKIWLENNLDLAMTPYKVLGTDCEQGFVEFVGNTMTLADMQWKDGLMNTFDDDTVFNAMYEKTAQEVAKKMGTKLVKGEYKGPDGQLFL